MSSEIISDWMNVDGFPTYVQKIGSVSQQTKSLILIVPGNPGISDYYERFMSRLYELSDRTVPVWCVSHAGHVLPTVITGPSSHSKPSPLCAQISHKLAFIQHHVPQNVKLTLIGHSIGCYMILSMLRELPRERIFRSVLLFPTIERMAESPSGLFVTPLLRYTRWILPWLIYPFYWLSDNIKSHAIRWHLGLSQCSDERDQGEDCAVRATLKLIQPRIIHNVIDLGHCEMCTVRDPDLETIAKNLGRVFLYYGAHDRWAPKDTYYESMRRYCAQLLDDVNKSEGLTTTTTTSPDLKLDDIIRCDTMNTEHAFVIKSSHQMAEVVWDWLRKNLY